MFTDNEIAYLHDNRIGRLATVDSKGYPHVVATGYRLDSDNATFHIGAADAPGRGQKRLYLTHIRADPHVAFIIDDVVTEPHWAPRGLTVRGRAVIHPDGGEQLGPGFGPIWTQIIPETISSWGIDTATYDPPNFRKADSAQ